MLDLQLPAKARRRRVTLANVSAVCEQLGEHVSTRNVQRVLGGSLRDIAPLVQKWRSNRAGSTAVDADGDSQALGAIVRGALQEHGEAVAAALQEQAAAHAASQQALLDRVQRLVHERLRATGIATPMREGKFAGRGEGNELAEVGSRIDRLTQAVEQLQAEQRIPLPDSADATIASALSAALGNLEARIAPVAARLDVTASAIAAAVASAGSPDLAPALDRIQASLVGLATPKSPVRAQASKAILTRMDALLAATAELPARLKAAITPPKPKRKTTAPRTARKPAVKKAARRNAMAATSNKSTKPARKAAAKKAVKIASKKTVKSTAASRRTSATRSPRESTVTRRKKTSGVAAGRRPMIKPRIRTVPTPTKKAAPRKSKR